MARLLHTHEWSRANERQNRSNNQIVRPEKCEGAKMISGLDSTPVINNLSKKTDRMRKLLKKDSKWKWTTEMDDDF